MIDIDSDFSPEGKNEIQDYLINKYGKEQVIHVGTFSTLGVSSAAKDLLRVYKVDFKLSNDFTKALNKELTWEQNIEMLKTTNVNLYNFYEQHKTILDMVPYFVNKVRQSGTHAGGIVITDKPIWNYVPINRVSGELATAFPESGSEQVLDEIGLVKFDILGITILEVIDKAINMIEEKLFLIEENNVIKIVGESYLNRVDISV
jgi:DNA polymerase-3 subunit alpha